MATDVGMAIYRCEAKIVSRGSGHSAVAAAAYRTGTKLKDERLGRTHDYSSRTKGVVDTVILRPTNSPDWTGQTVTLWNGVERFEKRKDAQLCREFVLALPKELSNSQQWECAVGWAANELVSKGMVAEVSLHHVKGRPNPHVHILCTMRTLEGDKFSAKKSREWNEKSQLLEWRESWCKAENAALEKAGCPERVDHRSLKAQGIDRQPEPKIGPDAKAVKDKGINPDPKIYQKVRAIKLWNALRPIARAIPVYTVGLGKNLWEQSRNLTMLAKMRTSSALKGTWQKFVESSRSKITKNDQTPER